MQREEIIMILKILEDTYDVKITDISMEVWYVALKDFSCQDVQNATFEYIRTGKYKPKPADIIDLIIAKKAPQRPEEISAQEAWALVYKAMCNSNYNSVAEFEKLPEMVQKAVGSPDNLRSQAGDGNFNLGVAQSNFIRAYNTLLERKENDYAMRLEAVKRGELSLEELTADSLEEKGSLKLVDKNI